MKLNEAVAARILEYCNNLNITVNKLCTMSGVMPTDNNTNVAKTPIFSRFYEKCSLAVPKSTTAFAFFKNHLKSRRFRL